MEQPVGSASAGNRRISRRVRSVAGDRRFPRPAACPTGRAAAPSADRAAEAFGCLGCRLDGLGPTVGGVQVWAAQARRRAASAGSWLVGAGFAGFRAARLARQPRAAGRAELPASAARPAQSPAAWRTAAGRLGLDCFLSRMRLDLREQRRLGFGRLAHRLRLCPARQDPAGERSGSGFIFSSADEPRARLARFGAFGWSERSIFSSQIFFAANEFVGGKGRFRRSIMAKASREIDSLPMTVNGSAHEVVARLVGAAHKSLRG